MGIGEVKKPPIPICPVMSGSPVPTQAPGKVLAPGAVSIVPMAVPCAAENCMWFDFDKKQCSIKSFMIG